MKKKLFERRGKLIVDVTSKVGTKHKSISQAKKASHKIQMDNDGALGRGSLRIG